MKLVVVGGVAGGASAAARVRRLDETAEITIFERGQYVSYSNCSLPYYLGGEVADQEDLIMMTPEAFKSKHNIDVCTNAEVTAVDPAAHTVTVRTAGGERTVPYDKLVLAPGAAPILPRSIAGIGGDHVHAVRSVTDVVRIRADLDRQDARRVVVVGGGFIGVETAENLCRAGKQVTVVEGAPQIMAPFDHDMVQTLHKELDDHGVALYLNTTVTAITDGAVTVRRGEREWSLPADAVIMAIGVAPETALAKGAGLAIGTTGGIKVDAQMRTSDPDIYAVGDAVETFDRQTGLAGRLALAGAAQKQARVAADNICGIPSAYAGFIGSSCIRVFSQNAASTGLNERTAQAAGLTYDSVTVYSPDKVGIMPDCHYMGLKLLFEVPSGRLLGAQAIGQGEVDKRINAIAALIGMGGAVRSLIDYEHCYAPLFSTAKDVVHMAALVADNVLSGRLRQVHVSDVRPLVESGACIVDVRESDEYDEGHIKGAKNVPLSTLRQHLDEIPRDVPVYLHCRSSQRSYYAYSILRGHGWDNVYNISGSFLGLSLYEYYPDKAEGREPIVTAYNFE